MSHHVLRHPDSGPWGREKAECAKVEVPESPDWVEPQTSGTPHPTRYSVGLGAAAGFVILAVFGLVIGGASASNLSYHSSLETHGVTTTAVVTSTDSGNHNSLCYRFVADGESHAWCGTGENGEVSALKPGQTIQIVYDRTQPTVNCWCRPSAAAHNDVVSLALMAAMLVAFAGFVGFFTERKTRGAVQPSFRSLPRP